MRDSLPAMAGLAAAVLLLLHVPAAAKVEPVRPQLEALPRQELRQSHADAPCLEVDDKHPRFILWTIRAHDGTVVSVNAFEIRKRC